MKTKYDINTILMTSLNFDSDVKEDNGNEWGVDKVSSGSISN